MNNSVFMKQWLEGQEKLINQWQSFFTDSVASDTNENNTNQTMDDMYKAQQEWFKRFMNIWTPNNTNNMNPWTMFMPFSMNQSGMEPWKMMTDAPQKMMENWQQLYQNNPYSNYLNQLPNMYQYLEHYRHLYDPMKLASMMDSETFQTLNKMMDGNQQFLSLYRYFDELRASFVDPIGDETKEQMQKWFDDNQQFYIDFVEPFIPIQIREVLRIPQEIALATQKNVENYVGPWADSYYDMSRLYIEGVNGDTDKLKEFFMLWKENYNETIKPFLNLPGMSNQTEKFVAQNNFIDSSINLTIASVEFQQKIAQVANKQSRHLITEFSELLKDDNSPKTYREFYNYWSKSIEKTLQEYFSTDEFAKMLAEFGTANSKMLSAQNNLIELSLRDTPIVTQTEARSLAKKTQEMRREINQLKRELNELKSAKNETINTQKSTTKSCPIIHRSNNIHNESN